MQKFWDVHTHQKNNENSIYNVIAGKDAIPVSGYFSIGIHPWYYKESEENNLIEIVNKAANNPRCLAIGECGLDKLKGEDFQLQEKVFIRQIEVANNLNKPLIIHCVKYYPQLKKLIEQNNFSGPIVLHGFNQNLRIAKLFESNNYYFSLGKSLFNDNGNAQEILKKYYPQKIVFETDDTEILIDEIYLKASLILNVNKNEIVLEIQNNIKTIFAKNISEK
jgi:TatD DNase family protein